MHCFLNIIQLKPSIKISLVAYFSFWNDQALLTQHDRLYQDCDFEPFFHHITKATNNPQKIKPSIFSLKLVLSTLIVTCLVCNNFIYGSSTSKLIYVHCTVLLHALTTNCLPFTSGQTSYDSTRTRQKKRYCSKSNNDLLILIHHDDYLTIQASETVAQTSQSRRLNY